jgi:hypothetical protein
VDGQKLIHSITYEYNNLYHINTEGKMKITRYLLALLTFSWLQTVNAAEYTKLDISIDETKISRLIDSAGRLGGDDSNTRFGFGVAFGENLKGSWRTETELRISLGPDLTSWTGTSKYDIITVGALQSVYRDFDISQNNKLFIGGGIGLGITRVETKYESSGTTWSGSQMNYKPMFQASVGVSLENGLDMMLRFTDYGSITGPSGDIDSSSAYLADMFELRSVSVILRYPF